MNLILKVKGKSIQMGFFQDVILNVSAILQMYLIITLTFYIHWQAITYAYVKKAKGVIIPFYGWETCKKKSDPVFIIFAFISY